MGFINGLLTFILVVDCMVLVFLVLIQLPKKEAGAGLAFGGAASDALFGAGSGNVLTKITKYAAGIFFVLAIFLSLLQGHLRTSGTSKFTQAIGESASPPAGVIPPGPTPAKPAATSSNLAATPSAAESTNLPTAATAASNTSPATSK
jgi:preprotein translocase subunit SecG